MNRYEWYNENKKDIQYIFGLLINSIEKNNVVLDTPIDIIYIDFIQYVLNNSSI